MAHRGLHVIMLLCCLGAPYQGAAAEGNASANAGANAGAGAGDARPRAVEAAALRQAAWDEEWEGHDSGSEAAQGDAACPRPARCLPLRRCKLVHDLLDRSCLDPERLRGMSCGYSAGEAMVCCPRGAEESLTVQGGSDWGGGGNSWGGTGSGGGRWPPTQTSDKATVFSETCGTRLVAGLKQEGLGAQPWVVRIGYKHTTTGKLTFPCCGSIIAPRTVLTAGHCALAKSPSFKLNSVVVGDYDSRGDPDCTRSFCALPAQTIPIKQTIIYPGYERKTFKHDIALLVLETPINYSVAAQPICLSDRVTLPYGRQKARLVGWGRLPHQEASSPRQQQLELPLQPVERCASIYSRVLPVTRMQLCAGGEEGRDACSGFGGAPLMLNEQPYSPPGQQTNVKIKYYQVGMASFGSDRCGEKDIPSVYTNVMKYIEWIKSNIQI